MTKLKNFYMCCHRYNLECHLVIPVPFGWYHGKANIQRWVIRNKANIFFPDVVLIIDAFVAIEILSARLQHDDRRCWWLMVAVGVAVVGKARPGLWLYSLTTLVVGLSTFFWGSLAVKKHPIVSLFCFYPCMSWDWNEGLKKWI